MRRYEKAPPRLDADRICENSTVCGPGQYEEEAPTTSSDRVCVDTTTCAGDQFQITDATATSDRACQECQPCGADHYVGAACGPTSDTVCRTCTTCTDGVSYASTPCTTTADASCSACTVCDGEEVFASSPCTATQDTICGNVTTDFTYTQWSEWSVSCSAQRRTRQQLCTDKACRNPQAIEEQRDINGGCEQECAITLVPPLGNPVVACSCQEGFVLQDDKTSCDPRSCGLTPTLPHATADTAGQELIFGGKTAVVTCDRGYASSGVASTPSFSRSCTAAGTLSNAGGVCEDVNECSSGLDNCDNKPCTNLEVRQSHPACMQYVCHLLWGLHGGLV